MAKKRVNTQLLTILVVGFIVICAGGAIAYALGFFRTSVPELIARAEAAEAEGEVVEAIAAYGQAARRDGSDAALYMKVHELAPQAAPDDETWYYMGQTALQNALEIDARHVPALRGRVESARLALGRIPIESMVREAIERGEALLAVEPDAADAKITVAKALVLRSLLTPEASTAEEQDRAAALLAELAAGDDPAVTGDGEAAALLAALRAGQVAEQRTYDRELARRTFDEAVEATDAFAARFPEHAPTLRQLYVARRELQRAALALGDEAAAEAQFEQGRAAALDAADLADPADEAYADILVTAAQLLGGDRRDEAISMLEAGVENRPSDYGLRRALALLSVDGNEPEKALALLREPAAEPEAYVDVEAMTRQVQAMQELGLRAEALVKLAGGQSAAEREATVEQARKAIDAYAAAMDRTRTREFDADSTRSPDVARLRGQLLLAQNRPSEALQALETARQLFGDRARTSRERRTTLVSLFAANRALNQTAPARQALEELLAINPGLHAIRFELAKLLIRENQPEAARRELEQALAEAPDNPQYQAAIVSLDARLNRDGDAPGTAAADAGYDELPEETQAQQVVKRAVAQSVGDLPEMLRLSRLLYEGDPDREGLAIDLANVLGAAGETDEAVETLQAYAARFPDAERAATLLDRLTSDPDDFRDRNASDYEKALRAYQELKLQEDEAAALAKLREAVELAPEDDDRARPLLVGELVSAGAFDDARRVIDGVDDPALRRLLGVALLVGREDIDGAATLARELREELPLDYRSRLANARVLQARGQTSEAADEYDAVLELQPFNRDALDGLIRTRQQLGDAEGTRLAIERAREQLPDDPLFREREMAYELQFGDPDKVLANRRELFAQNPDRPGVRLALAVALRASGVEAGRDGDRQTLQARMREIVEVLTPMLDENPDYPQLPRVAALLADAHQQLGQTSQGVAALERAAGLPVLAGTDQAALLLADFLVKAGEPDRARQVLVDRLAQDGADPVTLRRQLSSALLGAGQADEALAALEPGDRASAEQRLELTRSRVETMVKLGRTDEALALADEALRAEPDDVGLTALAAFAHLRERDYPAAEARLATLDAEAEQDVRVRLVRGIYRASKPEPDLDGAASDFEAVTAQAPNNLDARRRLADVFARQGQAERAVTELEAVVEREPTSATSQLALAQLYQRVQPPRMTSAAAALDEALTLPTLKDDVALLQERGLVAARTRDDATARRFLRRAYEVAQEDGAGSLAAARPYYDFLLDRGDEAELIDEVRRQLQTQPEQAYLHQYLARGLARRGDADAAAASYGKAVEAALAGGDARPVQALLLEAGQRVGFDAAIAVYEEQVEPVAAQAPPLLMVGGQLYQQAGRYEQALAAGEAVVAAAGGEDATLTRDGQRLMTGALLELDPPRADEAVPLLEELLAERPDDVALMNNLAYGLTLLGGEEQVDRAVELSTRTVERVRAAEAAGDRGLAQAVPFILDTHGWALVLDGREEEGLDLIVEALSLRPFPQGFLHQAEAELKLGQSEAAAETARRGLQQAETDAAAGSPTRAGVLERLREVADAG